MRGISLRWACVCAALLLFLGPATGAALAAGKPFVAPVNAEVIRKFEAPSHKFGPGHRGIDYGVPSGTTVRASGNGTVTFAGPVADDGKFVTIEHPGGISTTYSYLSQIDVSNGDRVSQGQVIAVSGEGHEGGPPGLHFGAKKNGDYLDPEVLLKALDDISDMLALAQVQMETRESVDFSVSPSTSAFQNSDGHAWQPPDFSNGNNGHVPASKLPTAGPRPQSTIQPIPSELPARLRERSGPRLGEEGLPARRPGQSPAEWWTNLPEDIRTSLIQANPDHWRNVPGISAKDRDHANRLLLDREIARLRALRDSPEGQAEIQRHRRWIWFHPPAFFSEFDRETAIERKLRTAEELKKQLAAVARDPDNHLNASDVYLLDFDINFADGDGRAAVALGNPETAEHIGVFVPGINNAVGTLRGSLQNAANLRATVHDRIDKELAKKTSTIMWMGYDNPNGFHDALTRGEAKEGAPMLKEFVDALRARHLRPEKPTHITVFGHSYGSTVTGLAAAAGMLADDVVFLGSPGIGLYGKATDFSQHIWAARSKTDLIKIPAFFQTLGIDPMDPNFGALQVALGPEQRGHSEYFEMRSRGLLNFAKIMTSRMKVPN